MGDGSATDSPSGIVPKETGITVPEYAPRAKNGPQEEAEGLQGSIEPNLPGGRLKRVLMQDDDPPLVPLSMGLQSSDEIELLTGIELQAESPDRLEGGPVYHDEGPG